MALVVQATQGVPGAYKAPPGEFVGEGQWLSDGRLRSEAEFVALAERQDDSWPWWPYVGGREGLNATVESVREVLAHYTRWG